MKQSVDVREENFKIITTPMSATCKFLRPSSIDELSVDKKLLSRTSISRETSDLNAQAGMVLRLERRYE